MLFDLGTQISGVNINFEYLQNSLQTEFNTEITKGAKLMATAITAR